MEFYGLVEVKDWFGVVGRFGFVSYGFVGVLCCCETPDLFGVVGYGFMGVVKPRLVVVLAMLL